MKGQGKSDLDDSAGDILATVKDREMRHELLTPEKEAENSVSRIWAAAKKRSEKNSNSRKMLDAQA